jgi:hypothetical protein
MAGLSAARGLATLRAYLVLSWCCHDAGVADVTLVAPLYWQWHRCDACEAVMMPVAPL